MTQLKVFIAGFLATLVFHQGLLEILHVAANGPAPFDFSGVPPLHVPKVISLAFWGGIWAMLLWPLIRPNADWRYWLTALVLGAVGPSLVALLIVFPLKGMPFAAGWDPKIWVAAFLLNGAWGIGVALFMRWLDRPAAVAA
ncbi:MAG TPA: hypothetical protein VFB36_11745 [Nevskiaceae bacterium]|nr:hypothetical protein [Nevskiaceae bacterium]